jgi:hypothetical protein
MYAKIGEVCAVKSTILNWVVKLLRKCNKNF